jgi:hypothetical protein
MVHRKNPILGRLALCIALIAPHVAAAATAGSDAGEYNGASAPGLVSRATESGAARGRSIMAQNAPQTGEEPGEARNRLRQELDQIRRNPASSRVSEFDPPKPVRRKAAPAAVDGEAPPAGPGGFQTAAQTIRADPQIDKLIGQAILMRFRGSAPSDAGPKAIRALLQSGLIAGAVFGRENIQSKAQLKELMKFLSSSGGPGRPILAIREIGGSASSMPPVKDFEPWPSEKEVAARGDPQYAYSTYRSMGSSLAALGFNMNFGPRLTMPEAGENATATFGDNALQAGVFAKTFILGHSEANVLPVPILDDSDLAVRALKTLLLSYPSTVIATDTKFRPDGPLFSLFEGLVRGARFCFVSLEPKNEGAGAAESFKRGCDALVVEDSAESPVAVRERIAQGVTAAVQNGVLSVAVLNASVQRVMVLRSSHAWLSGSAPVSAAQ